MQTSRVASALVASAGIAIAAFVGYNLYKAAKERSEQRAIVSLVRDTTTQIRSSLKAASPEALQTVEGRLRATKSWSNRVLADAAEQYLIGAREIMRRRAEADRFAQKAAESRAALSTHMSHAGSRDTSWI